MRIGVISDIHGNNLGLEAVLADLNQQGIDFIVFAGDLVGYYPYVNEVFETVRKQQNIICILGNHDCYLMGKLPVTEDCWRAYNLDYVDRVIDNDHRTWLAELPIRRDLDFNGTKWLLCHGSPWAIDEYIYPNHTSFERFASVKANVIVMGHTHIPMIRWVDGILLLNPGSCGQPRDYNPLAAYALVDIEAHQVEIHRVRYDVKTVYHRVLTEGFDPNLAKILYRKKDEKRNLD